VRNEEECVCSVSVVRLIVATRSSGPPASSNIIKEMSGSVASGTPCIILHVSYTIPVNVAFKLIRNGGDRIGFEKKSKSYCFRGREVGVCLAYR
jgi:hypothetical protein